MALFDCAAGPLWQTTHVSSKKTRVSLTGARLYYARDSASIFSMSTKEKRIDRPKWWAFSLPDLRQRRNVMVVTCHRLASSAGVRKVGS